MAIAVGVEPRVIGSKDCERKRKYESRSKNAEGDVNGSSGPRQAAPVRSKKSRAQKLQETVERALATSLEKMMGLSPPRANTNVARIKAAQAKPVQSAAKAAWS